MSIEKYANWRAASLAVLIVSAPAVTVAADTELEPVVEYFKLEDGKLKPGKMKIYSYYEIKKDKRIYVFISPKAKDEFEKTGKAGKEPVTAIGFGPNGETVVFQSSFAQKEYEKKYPTE